ncbi:hypothetical protein NDU88_005076 [Pleurodeles waltl]|uniref:Uncharacterized protein n=1 Tax=Pleurodeles waltl TaxID=8319 RepID=A0AAV7SKT3_PLEWA|nr:hypothetical protein NDU88_005076 [Pleurodeles waltl]
MSLWGSPASTAVPLLPIVQPLRRWRHQVLGPCRSATAQARPWAGLSSVAAPTRLAPYPQSRSTTATSVQAAPATTPASRPQAPHLICERLPPAPGSHPFQVRCRRSAGLVSASLSKCLSSSPAQLQPAEKSPLVHPEHPLKLWAITDPP